MKKATFRLSAVIALALVSATAVYAQRVVSAFGQAQVAGKKVLVHVSVVVPPGLDGNEVARAALREQGARPFQGDEFSATGLDWDQFSNGIAGDDFVTQNYNPANEPAGGLSALLSTHGTWGGVGTSIFAFNPTVNLTDRCPSLVRECGFQRFDGFNDVAWLRLNPRTLGVTWFSTSRDEADMALNTRFDWVNRFDAQTVFLHENGHVFGAGHSSIRAAVMYPSYQEPRISLHCDDVHVITHLYPAASSTGSIAGTVTDADGTPIFGALVVVEDSPLFHSTNTSGAYSIGGVPKESVSGCLYDVTASADGFDSATEAGVQVPPLGVVDFALRASGGDDGGGVCVNPGGLPKGAGCGSDAACCSNKCKGPAGAKSCKGTL